MFNVNTKGMLMQLLMRKSRRMGVAMAYGSDGIDLIRELMADTDAARARRAAISEMNNADVAQLLALSLVAKRINESGALSWETVDWNLILPFNETPRWLTAALAPLMSKVGPLVSVEAVMNVLMEAVNSINPLDLVMGINGDDGPPSEPKLKPQKPGPKKRRFNFA